MTILAEELLLEYYDFLFRAFELLLENFNDFIYIKICEAT